MVKRFTLFLSFMWLIAFGFAQQVNHSTIQKSVSLNKSGFYENKGQITDQNYKPNPAVKYLLCSPGFNVQLRQTGFSYDTYTDATDETEEGGSGTLRLGKDEAGHFDQLGRFDRLLPKSFTRHYHRVDIELQ